MKQKFFLLVIGGMGLSSCSPATATPSTTTQAMVNKITGNARGSRDDARALRRQSDERLAAKDYSGAMKLRWQMMGIRGNDESEIGSLVGSAIQSLALDDVANVAVHLDAPSCRHFADELAISDAKAPSYAAILSHEKASQLKSFAGLTRDPQQWQKTIADLFENPNEHEQQELKTLQATPVTNIKANIEKVYDQAIEEAAQSFLLRKPQAPVDLFTRFFASPSPMARFIWTRDKTQRLLIVAALRARADRLQKRTGTTATLADPFGNGSFRKKNGVFYSLGPDGKDDGGKFASGVTSKRPAYLGDIAAPSL